MAIDVNELLAPIPGSDPAGSDASFSDQFDRIREARRADDPNLAQGEWKTELKVADWRVAQSLSEEILLRTSKDLQAAVWLAEAVISREGLEGARDGFALLAGLLDTYWDGVYPRAEDGDLEERAGKLACDRGRGALRRGGLVLLLLLGDLRHAAAHDTGADERDRMRRHATTAAQENDEDETKVIWNSGNQE